MRFFFFLLACSASLMAAGELSGRRAPGFSLMDMNFKQYDSQDYRGKILLIDIMQTTCPHCAMFSSILEEAVAKHRGKVAALSIVIPPDNMTTINQYIAEHKITVPILYDCSQVSTSYFKATPRNPHFAVPHLFIIDAQGMIVNDYEYSESNKEIFEGKALFAELDRMLKGK
jgi:peroxiredoxin